MLHAFETLIRFRWNTAMKGIRFMWFFPQLARLAARCFPQDNQLNETTVANFCKEFTEGNLVFPSLRVKVDKVTALSTAEEKSRLGKISCLSFEHLRTLLESFRTRTSCSWSLRRSPLIAFAFPKKMMFIAR